MSIFHHQHSFNCQYFAYKDRVFFVFTGATLAVCLCRFLSHKPIASAVFAQLTLFLTPKMSFIGCRLGAWAQWAHIPNMKGYTFKGVTCIGFYHTADNSILLSVCKLFKNATPTDHSRSH